MVGRLVLINYFVTEEGKVVKADGVVPGCWIDVVEPTGDERAWLRDELGIVEEFVRSAFDDEEMAHADYDEDTGQALVIIDCPLVEDESETVDKSIKSVAVTSDVKWLQDIQAMGQALGSATGLDDVRRQMDDLVRQITPYAE